MTRRLRHSPSDCDLGDFFPCPVNAGDNCIWYWLAEGHSAVTAAEPTTLDWPPRWEFRRAAWRSDSGPYVIDVFVRRS